MALTTVQLVALKSELTADPKALGYPALLTVGNQQGCADLLNLIHATGGDYQVNNEPVAPSRIVTQITPEDFQTMTTSQQGQLALLFVIPSLDLSDDNTFDNLSNCFPNEGQTITNLTLLKKRQGARGEVLFGNGFRATANDISNALSA